VNIPYLTDEKVCGTFYD